LCSNEEGKKALLSVMERDGFEVLEADALPMLTADPGSPDFEREFKSIKQFIEALWSLGKRRTRSGLPLLNPKSSGFDDALKSYLKACAQPTGARMPRDSASLPLC